MLFQLLFFAFVVFLLVTLLISNGRKAKGDGDGGHGSIPTIIRGRGVFKEVLIMSTVNRDTANYEYAYNLGRERGPVVAFEIPAVEKPFLTATDFNICKKVMSSSLWPDRVSLKHYMHRSTFDKPLGLLFGSGEWREKSSRLTVKLLHQFEFFKPQKMESLISFEMSEIEADLTKRIDEAGGMLIFSPHTMFEVGTMNVVCEVLFGRRYSPRDPMVLDLLDKMNTANREFSLGYTMLEVIPWLKYFPRLTWLHSLAVCSDMVYRICSDIIRDKRKHRMSLKEEPKDFVDAFLQDIDKKEDPMLTDEMLLGVLRDMIFAGTDTVNSALEHGILHVSLQTAIQKKVQAEIDEIIGPSRAPIYADRTRMPYTQAVILEILRIASPVPVTMRASADDTYLEGYPLQKGCHLAIHLYAIHRSEEIWDDPLVFRPERFLSEGGTLVNTEKIIPFGYGKRSCVGESVARVTLFLFFVTLLQKFSFEISPNHPSPSFKNPKGLSRCPMPYYVQVRKRCY